MCVRPPFERLFKVASLCGLWMGVGHSGQGLLESNLFCSVLLETTHVCGPPEAQARTDVRSGEPDLTGLSGHILGS